MQKIAFKLNIIIALLSTNIFLDSFAENINIKNNRDRSDKIAILNSPAGCMGCHQGETITMSDNKLTDKNMSLQFHQNDK